MDLVIRDADVVDGTGGASYRADVGVHGRPDHHDPPGGRRRPAAPRPARRWKRRGPRAVPRLHRHARPQRPRAAARPGPQREGRAGRHARSPRPGRPVVRAGRRPHARRGPPRDHRLERRRQRHRLRLAHGRRVPGPPGPRLRGRDRGQRRVPDPAGHRPDARGRLGRPRRHAAGAGPDAAARRRGHGAGRRRHVLRPHLHARHVREGRRTHRAVPGGGRRTAATTARTTARTAPGRSTRTRRWWSSPARRAARSISRTPP